MNIKILVQALAPKISWAIFRGIFKLMDMLDITPWAELLGYIVEHQHDALLIIRRKFFEIVDSLDKESLKNSKAVIGLNYCTQIYNLEKELRETYSTHENYHEIRYKERLLKLAPILDDFLQYINIEIPNALPRSPLGKALDYSKKLVPSLKNVLLDGVLEIDNNATEREIKPFVMGRKNFLFANTSKGAISSSYLYSIIETAKANGLIIEKYLVYLFNNLIEIDPANSECLENLMPWSNQIPDNIKIKEKK